MENNFEKQVQQKMDELKIHPSDSVWEKIEARIQKKNRSHKGLLLFIVLFALLFTGGYLVWNRGINTGVKDSHEKNNSENKTAKASGKSGTSVTNNNTFIEGSGSEKNGIVEKRKGKNITRKNIAEKDIAANGDDEHISKHTKRLSVKKTVSKDKSAVALLSQKEMTGNAPGKSGEEAITAATTEIQSANEKTNTSTDSVAKKAETFLPKQIVKDTSSIIKDTSEKKPVTAAIRHTRKPRWKLGIMVLGGISGVGNNFLGLTNSPAYNYSNFGGQVSNPGPSMVGVPSVPRAGFGFIAGAFAEKIISARMRLSAGINFKSFNTSNRVGNDSTGYYRSLSAVNTYRNRFNFIEVPVTLKIQVGKGNNVPLWWQGGLVVSELISPEALQFNPASGLYYTDNSLFNKTQVGLNTSLAAELFGHSKHSFLAGPYFYYDLSRLAREGLYSKKHFVYTGLRTQIIFGK